MLCDGQFGGMHGKGHQHTEMMQIDSNERCCVVDWAKPLSPSENVYFISTCFGSKPDRMGKNANQLI